MRIFNRTKIRQVSCKRGLNHHKPKPAAVILLQLQSRHSTGENAYIDLVICPEGERVKNKMNLLSCKPHSVEHCHKTVHTSGETYK